MRALLGRISLVILLAATLCGCRSGSMFAWGKKKSSDTDAPKFAAASPALPSAGQSPGTPPSNVAGTVAAGMPAYNSVNNPSTASSYNNQPGTYQQAVYPTTPHAPVSLSQNVVNASVPAATGNANALPPNNWANNNAAGTNNNAVAASYGASTPAPTAYGNSAAVQPQQGQYNMVYGGANGSTAASASSQTVTPATSPYANNGSTAMPSTPPDYRTADARNAMTSSPVASAPAPTNGSAVGDRYAHLNSANNLENPPANLGTNPTGTPADASSYSTGQGGDRYNLAPNNYQPSVPAGSATGYSTPNEAAAPSVTGSNPSVPVRPDPGYRPGGTSNFSPRINSLRPSANEGPQESQTPGRVVPANYESAAATTAPPVGMTNPVTSAHHPATAESYGAYQGAGAAMPPSAGSPNASPTQAGFFEGHSW